MVQVLARVSALNVPGAHGVAASDPTEQNSPSPHGMHCSAFVMTVMELFLCVPPGQGSGAAAPSWQYEPAAHALHAVAPSISWNVPGEHLVHASCAASALYVPALQFVGSALPTGQKVPLAHVAQSAALVITMPSRLVVPPGHGSAAAAPSAQ